ncbi:Serine/threonine-protein kinase svkA [Exophiala dermatitidis]
MVSQYSDAPQDRRPMAHTSPFEIQDDQADGETLAAKYQMLEELGSGSFGVVYKAIDKETGEIVAIKHVDLESSEEDLSDILSELSVLSSCSSPYVTKYRLAFLRRHTLWIVMEYLGGGSCADLLKPPPHSLAETHIAIICRELLLGLAYLHGEGKLHRDIKAANVLLGMDGRVKLADFGVAAQLVGLKSVRNTFVGTPFWMAPEVIQQEGHDAKADIWSLGITAMELANGEPPHANVHPMKVLFLIPKQPAPRLEGGKWSRDFKDFVACCLTKDVEKRSSAKDLLKHRFIRSAGKVEGLQELIVRKQDWEARKGGDRHLKYYAETLKSLSSANSQTDDDDWVFETIKAVPTISNSRKASHIQATQRRRKVSADTNGGQITRMVEDGHRDYQLPPNRDQNTNESPTRKPSTMRRISESRHQPTNNEDTSAEDTVTSPTASMATRTARRTSRLSSAAQARQPLGVNMSFGNSPSTVRQFRRVSTNLNAVKVTAECDGENDASGGENQAPSGLESDSDPDPNSSVVRTPSKAPPKIGLGVFSSFSGEDMLESKSKSSTNSAEQDSNGRDPKAPTKDQSSRSTSSSTSGATNSESKESSLGKRLYAQAVGISCQDVLDDTADHVKREAVARLAEAFSDLEAVDPDGLFHVMRAVVEKVKLDSVLSKAMRVDDGRGPSSSPVMKSETTITADTTEAEQQHERDQTESEPPTSTSTSVSVLGGSTTSTQTVPSTTTTTTAPTTPKRVQSPAPAPASPALPQSAAKLVLAQNNPHLKSHRRRQSAHAHAHLSPISANSSGNNSRNSSGGQIVGGGSPLKKTSNPNSSHALPNVGSPRASGGNGTARIGRANDGRKSSGISVSDKMRHVASPQSDKDKDIDMIMKSLVGGSGHGGGGGGSGLSGGLEHTRQLADVLFERWCDGLRMRWPAV